MLNLRPEMRTESRSAGNSRFAGRRIHFIGIGGSGMSGLARMLHDRGVIVSGSEPKPSAITIDLRRLGIKISRTQSGELLSREIDLVVRTAAVSDSNGEYQAARALRLPVIKYAELLGQVMAERLGIAVAGTHGKSTTSAMTAWALLQCGADPSFVIGGTVRQLGGGSRSGTGTPFVAEACEYDRSFHNLRPTIACITNLEADHLDCYKDLDDIIESFRTFARLVPATGLILANGVDDNLARALSDAHAPVQTVAIEHPADWSTRITGQENGCYRGEISFVGSPVATLEMSVAGVHNLFNATLAAAACAACGIDPAAAAKALGEFSGVDRRMSLVGDFNGATVVDDYGHHPTEIRTTLAALRGRYNPRRLLCVFQPHQASRTRLLFDDFANSFGDADEAILSDIYFVRDSEEDRLAVSSAQLVEHIRRKGRPAQYLPKFEQIREYLLATAQAGDLIVTMGAGPVWEVGRDLVHAAAPAPAST